MQYKVGQKVWLRVKNITIERQSQKLDWQKYGRYRIIKKTEKVAYHLDLPSTIFIYNVFYVNLFRDYKSQVSEKSPELQPIRLAIDLEVGEFEVEVILALQIQSNLLN